MPLRRSHDENLSGRPALIQEDAICGKNRSRRPGEVRHFRQEGTGKRRIENR
jgi:hypothetical protein